MGTLLWELYYGNSIMGTLLWERFARAAPFAMPRNGNVLRLAVLGGTFPFKGFLCETHFGKIVLLSRKNQFSCMFGVRRAKKFSVLGNDGNSLK